MYRSKLLVQLAKDKKTEGKKDYIILVLNLCMLIPIKKLHYLSTLILIAEIAVI